jgi:hypothetical protein
MFKVYENLIHDAMESTISSYMCGMAAFDLDDPCYEIFHCDPSLECDTHLESEYYVSRIQPSRLVMCCHCAGTMLDSPVEMNTHLMAP